MSQDLKNIPGIGKNIEQHLFNIGIRNIDDLKGKNPEELFYEDIGFDALFHNKSVFLLGDTPSDDMEISWQEVGISMRRRAFN